METVRALDSQRGEHNERVKEYRKSKCSEKESETGKEKVELLSAGK